ncbi:MAG TPA: multicopper oxidase domain-containing protein [Gaiellaceae bacterium]|nr:multicopper oxidase domain-containing protein [Gaiellaceae bacterium]
MAAQRASTYHSPVETESGAFYKLAAILLGFAVGVVGVFALLMWTDAREARDDTNQSAAQPAGERAVDETAPGHDHAPDHNTALPLASFAGVVPENAAELAEAHKPYDATLPPAAAGDVVEVQMTLKDMTVEVAPGVKYNTWAFDGHGAPGPIIHVREGQKVHMTLTNGGAIPHSIDFHAARIAPNVAFTDVAPGESLEFSFTASDPGVYMYHCGTKPVLAHIANGMYGAIVVQPKKALPPVDNEYVLVGSEWYLNGDGIDEPASLDMSKARARMADWVTFNGYANQYVTHPLTANPGETTRFWVVAAGPTNNVNFHVVGAMLDRAWVNSDLTQYQRNVQTAIVPAGGGAVFDVTIPDEGLYPFVSHAFADVDLGQVGLLKVGRPKGTMSH